MKKLGPSEFIIGSDRIRLKKFQIEEITKFVEAPKYARQAHNWQGQRSGQASREKDAQAREEVERSA